MWTREHRVWARGGQVPRTCPCLVHTVRRACPQLDWGTALGPKDASTFSALGVVGAAVVVSAPLWTREELARAGSPPPGHGRCSFDTHRGTPARDTLGPKRGAMQASSAVRIIRTGDVRSPATAPTRARPRAGHAPLAGTVLRATPPSACCPTVWPHGYPGLSMRSKRSSPPPSRPRAVARRAMRCVPMRSNSRERCAGSSAGSGWSITS